MICYPIVDIDSCYFDKKLCLACLLAKIPYLTILQRNNCSFVNKVPSLLPFIYNDLSVLEPDDRDFLLFMAVQLVPQHLLLLAAPHHKDTGRLDWQNYGFPSVDIFNKLTIKRLDLPLVPPQSDFQMCPPQTSLMF